jgi:hypothetical protein
VAKSAELQIERPHTFLKHERTFQRVGVSVLTLFVLAGAAGAFGDGPLGRATTLGSTHLRYERFGRTTAPTAVAISVVTGVADGEPVRFRMARAFLEDVDFLELRPPDALKAFDQESALFEVAAVGGRGHAELHYKPARPGIFRTAVIPEAAEGAQIWQLIFF